MTSKCKGNIGEMAVAKDLMQQGYSVFTELGDSCRTDLIAIVDNKPIKIQVKAGIEKGGCIGISTFKAGKAGYSYTYTSDDCDVFAVYNLNRDIVSYVGWDYIKENSNGGFGIRYTPPKNNQMNKVHMFNKFEDFKQHLGTLIGKRPDC